MARCRWGALALALALGGSSAQGGDEAGEYDVKAAYLVNFTRYVTWPALSPGDPLVLGILGRDPFGGALEALAQKSGGEHPLHLRRLRRVEEADQGPLHILFVSASEEERLPAILRRLDGRPVLTVGESRFFAERGGMIELEVEGRRVRFSVNLTEAEESRLAVSSQLLKLARVVDHDPTP